MVSENMQQASQSAQTEPAEHQKQAKQAEQAAQTFDTQRFLQELDEIFASGQGPQKAQDYLLESAVNAENVGDDAGLLTVLNELMGYYRSVGKHEENQWIIQRAIELALRMRLEGSEAWTTTLINAATSMRAAKRYDQAQDLYSQALANAQKVYALNDRRLAALHNNYSMLLSETGKIAQSIHELEQALNILTASSVDPERDIDIAATHTNIALALLQMPESSEKTLNEAYNHAKQSLAIYHAAGQETTGHYASALAGFAHICLTRGEYGQAVTYYGKALESIKRNYGTDSENYQLTRENYEAAMQAAQQHGVKVSTSLQSQAQSQSQISPDETAVDGRPVAYDETTAHDETVPANATIAAHKFATNNVTLPGMWQPENETYAPNKKPKSRISGLKLSRSYYEQVVRPMLREQFPELAQRIAAGLVGHGSDCYGFDDVYSQDHDFGPGCYLWLTDEDYATHGKQLQEAYDALPTDFMGFTGRTTTPRARNAAKRCGVTSISGFFESVTSLPAAPSEQETHLWLNLDEATLAAATNGEVFADPLGAFSKVRQGFKNMPEDVRISLISRRLGMMAQAGQYNTPRMIARADAAGIWLSISEFVHAASSLVFLVNTPIVAGYMPYYKWQFAALRKLSSKPYARLGELCPKLERLMALASAAGYAGVGLGEGEKGSAPAARELLTIISDIGVTVANFLYDSGLSDNHEPFLEWQRPHVEAHIQNNDPLLRSL